MLQQEADPKAAKAPQAPSAPPGPDQVGPDQAGPDQAAAALFRAARDRWPEPVTLLADDREGSAYDAYPALFAPAFPGVTPAGLSSLAAAGRFYAMAMFAVDIAIDQDQGSRGVPHTRAIPLEILALLHEAYTALGGLFPAASPFWPQLGGCLHRFAWAIGTQQAFIRGERDTSELEAAEALTLAREKAAVAEVTVHSLAALAGGDAGRAGPSVVGSIADYNVVCQFLDDICDWRNDARAGRPSLVLAEAMRVAGVRAADLAGPDRDRERELDALGRVLYFSGPAEKVLGLAEDALARARESVAGLPLDLWRRHLGRTAERARLLRGELAVGTAAGRSARPDPDAPASLAIRLPAADGNPVRAFALGTLRWLLDQWRLGFREAGHMMRFSPEAGFTGSELQFGDVFARAVAAGTLQDADAMLDGQLRPCVDREVGHLLSLRRPEPGLWSYFPGLPELPPDADDVAEVLRVLVRHGAAAGEIEGELRRCLALAFGPGAHEDGSFETWLIPAGDDATAARQRDYARLVWGRGADVEVMANLLDAVSRFDPDGYAAPVAAGIRHVLAAQEADGGWPVTWYQTRLYGAYVCARLLAGQPATGKAGLARCARYIEAQAADDGGWPARPAGAPDPVSTSLGLLTLAEIRRAGLPVPAGLAERGLRRLMRWQEPDSGLPRAGFIRMELGRAGGGEREILGYGSRTVTTALACRAALAWTERPA